MNDDGSDGYVGHYRVTSENYTVLQRREMVYYAEKTLGANYEFLTLYSYWIPGLPFQSIPEKGLTPNGFRCDGLAEWTTEMVTLNNVAFPFT